MFLGYSPLSPRQAGQEVSQSKQKAVRIVSTGRQGRNPLWVSTEDENAKSPDPGMSRRRSKITCCSVRLVKVYSSPVGTPSPSKCCVTLMPYTLVTPHYPPVCRPVLLLPTVLGRILDKKLAGWQGFQLCEPGKKRTFSSPDKFVRAGMWCFIGDVADASLPLLPIFCHQGSVLLGKHPASCCSQRGVLCLLP